MAQHETILGDENNHEAFVNPNINASEMNNDCNKTDILLDGITLMGFSSDSQPLKFNENNNKNVVPLRNGIGITLMGSCSTDLKFRNNSNGKYDNYIDNSDKNDEIKMNQSITLMGNTCTNANRSKPKKRKKISSESYWKMFVFQQPQIFTQIISYLLPYQKIRISNVATFINQFIFESQLKYIIQSNDIYDIDDEKLMELKPVKLKTNWQKYDVIDYEIDQMIWKNQYSHLIDTLNYKSLIINVQKMSLFNNGIMKEFWNWDLIKQLKYFLINQIKLSKIYYLMEMNRIEDHMYNSNSYMNLSPLSQILYGITDLNCKNNNSYFGNNGMIFCSDILSSNYCRINSVCLSNNSLSDECIEMFCNQLLCSKQLTTSLIVCLDLSYNMNITGECIEILFTLIGEKCKLLNRIDLSYTSVDDRVCNAIYEYYRCYYGCSSCSLKYVELVHNEYITMNGVRKLNEIFVREDRCDVIILSEEDDKKFNLMECVQLENVNHTDDIDYRIIISKQSEQVYIDKRATYVDCD